MAMSRHRIKKAHKNSEISPSFRQASEFDFFSGQSGSIFRLDIFDGGTFCEQMLATSRVCQKKDGVPPSVLRDS